MQKVNYYRNFYFWGLRLLKVCTGEENSSPTNPQTGWPINEEQEIGSRNHQQIVQLRQGKFHYFILTYLRNIKKYIVIIY